MAIDRFRNENSHTEDGNISDPIRAYDVALTASVSAMDSVPQKDDAVAEPGLVDQFQLQPYTIRDERFSAPTTVGQTTI